MGEELTKCKQLTTLYSSETFEEEKMKDKTYNEIEKESGRNFSVKKNLNMIIN